MKPFEFIAIFVFIIFGMSISEVIVSIANLLRQFDHVVFYLPLLIWMLTGWMLTINYFFSFYRLQKIQTWTRANFVIVIFFAVSLVLSTYLVVPDSESLDMKQYFQHNRHAIYGTVIVIISALILEAYYLHRSKQRFTYIFSTITILLMVVAILNDSTFMDYFVSLMMFAFQVVLTFRSRRVIGESTI